MRGQNRRPWFMALCMLGMLFLVLNAFETTRAQQTGPNLLTNGDFEQDPGKAWPFEMGIQEIQVAPGWHAFWVDSPSSKAARPSHCGVDTTCYWGRPEFRGISATDFAYRVRGGDLAQKYFTFNRQHEAGLYQHVTDGIQPGDLLRFQIYMQTWSCSADKDKWNVCPTGEKSNDPAYMHTRVGIDPTGGTNPWAGTVVWATEQEAYDTWTLFTVEATAQNSAATVFTYSRADWYDTWPRIHNDVYIDDGSLVVVGETQPTAAPPPPTPRMPPTPRATSTSLPDGAVVHVVEPGETLFGIALEYGVAVEELRRLNAGTLGENDLVAGGQELVISGIPIKLPTPTPEPADAQPLTLPGAVTTRGVPAVPQTGKSSLCVVAYNDRDGDGIRKADSEDLLPNVTLLLVGSRGPAGTYTTDGISEPYCFQGLEPGNYMVRQTTPAGYEPSGATEWEVLLGAGQTYSLEVGYLSDTEEVEPLVTEGTAGKPANGLLGVIIKVSGIAAVLLAVTVAGLFFTSRRKATP